MSRRTGPRRGIGLAPAGLAACLALTGCETLVVGPVDATLFPTEAPSSAPLLSGRIALDLAPTVREQLHTGPDHCRLGRSRPQLPLGAIVDAALQRQLGSGFTGGVRPAALPLADGGDVNVALSVIEMRLILDRKVNWLIPIPAPFPIIIMTAASSTDYTARLELDIAISDAMGRVLSRTTVDSGTVLVERGTWTIEPADQRCLMLTHRAAWQAAAEAAKVVREAVQAEHRRERPL